VSFWQAVFLPNAVDFNPDWLAVCLAVFGFAALFKFRLGILKLISIFATIGFLVTFLDSLSLNLPLLPRTIRKVLCRKLSIEIINLSELT
jgi:predicted RND superfamily exporter protein